MRALHLPLALLSLSALVASSPTPGTQQQDFLILDLSNRPAPAPSSEPPTQPRPDLNTDDELLQAISDRLHSDPSFLSRIPSHLLNQPTNWHPDLARGQPLEATHKTHTCSDISGFTIQLGGTGGARWVFHPETGWLVAVLGLAAFVMSVMMLGGMVAAGVGV